VDRATNDWSEQPGRRAEHAAHLGIAVRLVPLPYAQLTELLDPVS
jgi:hypothetical protein